MNIASFRQAGRPGYPRHGRREVALRGALVVAAIGMLETVGGCGSGGPEPAKPPPLTATSAALHAITVAVATEENDLLMTLIVGDKYERSAFRDVAQIGCRTDPVSLMSVGPPFSIRTTWVKRDPAPDFMTETWRRVDALTERGFQRSARSGQETEPPGTRIYKDARGYGVTAAAKTRPSGQAVFEIYINSPCANP